MSNYSHPVDLIVIFNRGFMAISGEDFNAEDADYNL